MKKQFSTLLLCCGFATFATGLCPYETEILNSQEKVDNFATTYPGCTMLPYGASLYITGSVTNLDGSSHLTSIESNLTIRGTEVLTNLDGLSQITSRFVKSCRKVGAIL